MIVVIVRNDHHVDVRQVRERAPYRGLDRALDGPPVTETNLGLRWVDVDVDGVGRHRDIQEERRSHTSDDRGSIRCLHGACDSVVPHCPAVDREKRATR